MAGPAEAFWNRRPYAETDRRAMLELLAERGYRAGEHLERQQCAEQQQEYRSSSSSSSAAAATTLASTYTGYTMRLITEGQL